MSLSHVTYRGKDGHTDGSVEIQSTPPLRKRSRSLQSTNRYAGVRAAEDQTALNGVIQ